jgi:hypothetical protein
MDTIEVLARGHHRNNPPPATQKRDLRDLRIQLKKETPPLAIAFSAITSPR